MAIRQIISQQQPTGTPITLNLSGIQDGEWAFLSVMWLSSTPAINTPSGWAILKAAETTGTRRNILYGKVWHTGDPTTVTIDVATVKSAVAFWLPGPTSSILDAIIGASRVRSTVGVSPRTTNIAPSINVLNNALAIAISHEATTTAESPNTISAVNNGFVEALYLAQSGSTQIETIWVGQKTISPAGASGDTTITYRNAQDNNGWAIQIGIPAVVVVPTDPIPGFSNVFEMLRTPGATWAHRGGSLNWPEMSEYAYDQAVLKGYGALEFSAHKTLDNVWMGSHNPSLNDTAQTTGLPAISTMTWAQVQTYMNSKNSNGTPRPYYRLDAFLDKFTPTHVCLVDPKSDIADITAFLNLLDAHGGPSKIIVKCWGGDQLGANLADAARLRGYQTWGFMYATDNVSLWQVHYSILGMEISAAQADWDLITGFGKPVTGHIAQNQSNYNTARTKGAEMVQCADVAGITAVGQQDMDHLVEYNGTDLTQVELVEWDGTYLKAIQIVEKS